MGTLWQSAPIITLLCAELLFLLIRNDDIIVVLKRARQRTRREQERVQRGLVRSLVIELFLFVPASTALMLILVRPFILPRIGSSRDVVRAADGLMGVLSYGFPFGTLRAVMTRMSLRILTDFAAVTLQQSNEVESLDNVRALPSVNTSKEKGAPRNAS